MMRDADAVFQVFCVEEFPTMKLSNLDLKIGAIRYINNIDLSENEETIIRKLAIAGKIISEKTVRVRSTWERTEKNERIARYYDERGLQTHSIY
jgi:hypothetical protein